MLDCLKSALLATGLTLTFATAPQAAPVSFDLSVSFLNGPFVGPPSSSFLLTISYDDDDLTYGVGDPENGQGILNPFVGLEILFDGMNVEDLDVDHPDFPKVAFEDYIPISIDFLIDSFTFPELSFLGIEELRVGGDVTSDPGSPDLFDLVYDPATDSYSTGATVIEVAPIPLPAGLPLLAGGLGLMALAARRRTRS